MEILLVVAFILAILGTIAAFLPPEWGRYGVALIGIAVVLTIAKLLF